MIEDMSDNCKQYIRWMIRGVPQLALQYLSLLEDQELFRALSIPAREEIRDLFNAQPDSARGFRSEPLGAAMMSGQIMNRMAQLLYAYKVVSTGKPQDSAPTSEAEMWAKNYLFHCAGFGAIPLNVLEDLTDSLPAVPNNRPGLSDDDFKSAAATLGVDIPAMKAVAQVESSGSGFGAGGRPVIRFELHDFQGKTGHHFSKTHPYLSQKTWHAGDPYHDGTQAREYSMLYNAMLLKYKGGRAITQAIESASWGKFQVMGEHWSMLGWSSALQFASDMCVSEANHLKAFVRFVQHEGLTSALKQHQWATFASGYNGKSYKDNHYDTHLQTAFDRFNKTQPAAAVLP